MYVSKFYSCYKYIGWPQKPNYVFELLYNISQILHFFVNNKKKFFCIGDLLLSYTTNRSKWIQNYQVNIYISVCCEQSYAINSGIPTKINNISNNYDNDNDNYNNIIIIIMILRTMYTK